MKYYKTNKLATNYIKFWLYKEDRETVEKEYVLEVNDPNDVLTELAYLLENGYVHITSAVFPKVEEEEGRSIFDEELIDDSDDEGSYADDSILSGEEEEDS